MAPEQAAGARATEKVDVYGAVSCAGSSSPGARRSGVAGREARREMAGGNVEAIRKRLPRELVAASRLRWSPTGRARDHVRRARRLDRQDRRRRARKKALRTASTHAVTATSAPTAPTTIRGPCRR